MRTKKVRNFLLLLGMAVLLFSVFVPLTGEVKRAAAQDTAPTIELAYDDGVPFNIVSQSQIMCPLCNIYQGVRFDLGGVKVASVTAVRFYAGGQPSVLEVHMTDVTREHALITPIRVNVSAAQWYTVSVPETTVSEDFWVWVKRTGDKVMPYHDFSNDSGRSFTAEILHKEARLYKVERGDLMIRAVIRAEIHVGEGQDYATIQEAVDAAGEGLSIIVHEGTYNENVVVDKKLFITSRDGPYNTIVKAHNPGSSAFTVTANEVTISGFSIQGASGTGAAGVHLDGSTDCMVAANSISNNYYGVLVSTTSRANTVVDNDVSANVYGVWVDGQRTNISGNSIGGNTASLGSGLYLSATAADNEVHFNRFVASPGMEQAPQLYNHSTLQTANCVNNWWGHASGPYHSSANPAGTGAAVGEDVRFSPWLKAEPVAVKTATTNPGSYSLNARTDASTSVLKQGTGTPTVWVARYAGNPGAEFPETAIGHWIDVYLNNTTGVQQVEIRVHYSQEEIAAVREGSLRLYWWDGAEWKVCSRSGINTTERFVWAIVDPTTTPALAGLSGTPFVVGTTTASFAWWWIIVGILAVVLLVVLVRIVPRLLSRRSEYYYD